MLKRWQNGMLRSTRGTALRLVVLALLLLVLAATAAEVETATTTSSTSTSTTSSTSTSTSSSSSTISSASTTAGQPPTESTARKRKSQAELLLQRAFNSSNLISATWAWAANTSRVASELYAAHLAPRMRVLAALLPWSWPSDTEEESAGLPKERLALPRPIC